jgi:hypothetical protein
MAVKITIERGIRGKNKKSMGEEMRRELTLRRIMLCHHKIFREHVQK